VEPICTLFFKLLKICSISVAVCYASSRSFRNPANSRSFKANRRIVSAAIENSVFPKLDHFLKRVSSKEKVGVSIMLSLISKVEIKL